FEQLRQRVIAAYHLKPLDVDETRGYIEHRLSTAGWDGAPEFAPAVFEGIHDFTGGVPRRINTLCDRLLLYGCLEEELTIDRSSLDAVCSDIINEQGGPEVDGSQPSMVDATATFGNGVDANGQEPKAPDRLAAVESSVTTLADAVREEMTLLRKAILERDQN
ncbi:MAG: ATPase, partial [Gammaproteobacteria bacterium]|nr:ATPase [Gammaproteobacteria bacterium]